MRILAGRLRYQHRPAPPFRSAAGVARTWLPGWGPERLALWAPKPAAVPLGSPGLVQQQAPQPRLLRVLVALLEPLQAARNPVPQAQPDWRVGAFLAAWHRALARP
jgi:hypothetical protein